MHRTPRTTLHLAAVAAATALAACGGGGGGPSGMTLSTHALAFSAEQGLAASLGTVEIAVSDPRAAYVGAAYPAGQGPPPWLQFGVSQIDPAHFRLDVWVTDTSMAPGSYRTTFLVGIADADQRVLGSEAVAAELQVLPRRPHLTGSTPTAFAFSEGDGASPLPGYFALGVGGTSPRSCAATVALEDDGGWLEVSPSAVALGPTPTLFTVTARPGQPAGAHAGQLTVHCLIDGVDLTQAIPATFTVDDHRLVPGTVGVALVKTPTRSALSRQVRVADSLGRTATPWTATSDQPWLAVTPAGAAPGTLTLTADPAGLAAGTHLAWISLASSDATVGPVERIRVGLTVLDADPGPAFQPGYYRALAASPVEPVVFAASASGTDVTGFDLNTGAAVRTFTQVAASASRLAPSGDGTLLYVWDSAAFQVLELDAATGALQRSFAARGDWFYDPDALSGLAWVRPAGRPQLMAPSAAVYDLATGLKLGDPFVQAVQGGALVATADGAGVVTGSSTLFALHRTSVPAARSWAVEAAGPAFAPSSSNACPSADGGHLYRAAYLGLGDWDVAAGADGASYPLPAAEAVTVRRPICTTTGLLVAGAQSYPDGHDVWVFAPPSRTPVAALYSTGAVSAQYGGLYDLEASADSTRLAAFSAPQSGAAAGLYFHPLPAAP